MHRVTPTLERVPSRLTMWPILLVHLSSQDPGLLIPLVPSLVQALLMSIGVLAGMFFFTYLPQVAVLAVVTGPLGESVLLVCEFESVWVNEWAKEC